MPFKVNVSEKEDKSGEFKPLPAGLYHTCIVDVEVKESQSEANPGKPMLYFTFEIQDGVYAGQNMYANACCWSPALYTIINILKALGEYDNCKKTGELLIPDASEFYIGRDIMARRGINQKKKKENPEDDPGSWLETKGFSAYKPTGDTPSSSTTAGKSASSLLP